MSGFLRQSTSQIIRFGPFLDSTDGVTAETALTIAQADMQLSKDGGAFAQKNATGNATHDTDGWYSTTLNATDSATVGILLLQVVVAGSLPVWHEFFVVEEAVYDAIYAASAAGPLQSTVAGRTLDITATGAAGVDWANVENQSTSVNLSSTTTNLVNTTTTNTDQRGTDSAALATALATVDTNVDSILVDTAEIGVAGAGLTNINLPNQTMDIVGSITGNLSGSVGSVTAGVTVTTNNDKTGYTLTQSFPSNFSSMVITGAGAVDSLLQGILNTAITETSAGRIANNFDFFYDNANAQTTQVVDDVGGGGGGGTDWTASERNEIRGRLGVTGTTATGGNTPTLSTQASVDTVDSNVDAILVDTGTTIPASISGLNDVAATDIVSAGAITTLSGAVVNVDLVDTTTTNTDQRGTDSAALATALATVDSNVDAILVDTGTTIPASISGLNDVAATDIVSSGAITTSGGAVSTVTTVGTTTTNTDMRGTDSAATAANLATVDTNVDAILVDTGTTIPASITALNDISVSDILTTQMTEAYAADGVAPTVAQALFLIQQTIGDFSIAGTTITAKRINGSTTAATYTLDSSTAPTSRTRTT